MERGAPPGSLAGRGVALGGEGERRISWEGTDPGPTNTPRNMPIPTRFRAFALLLCAAVLAAGCGDIGLTGNPTHQVVITGGGTTLVSVTPAGEVLGTLAVGAGTQRTITISVLDRAGFPVTLGANDQIRVTVVSTPVATFTASATAANAVVGTLRGVSAGQTSLTVQLLRAGTSEYDSPNVPVIVG